MNIRNYYLIIITFLIIVGCSKEHIEVETNCAVNQPLQGWKVEKFDFSINTDHRDVYFPSEAVGFVCGLGGDIIKTSDSGLTWQELNTGTTNNLKTVYFIDENIGFASGNGVNDSDDSGAPVIKTTDGGKTWERYFFKGLTIKDIYFFDEQNGVALVNHGGKYKIAVTSNSGKNWDIQDLDVRSWYDKFFYTPTKIIVCGYKRVLYCSEDMGNTWDTIICPNIPYNEVRDLFIISENVWILNGSADVHKTTDGGKTWTEIKFNIFGRLVHFSSEDECFALDQNIAYDDNDESYFKGHIVRQTFDGGNSWTTKEVDGGCVLLGLSHFPSSNVGYTINQRVFRFIKE